MPVAYIALGSNVPGTAGSPRETLDAAARRLAELGKVIAISSYYTTEPVGYADQPLFVNAAAAVQTTLPPEQLLHRLLAFERDFGRDRSHGIPNGPRTLDLDLIFYGDLVLTTGDLEIPHPRMHLRAFVLDPLAEIAPAFQHPTLQRTMAELRDDLPN